MRMLSNSCNFTTNTVSPNGFTSLYLRAKQGHLSHLKCVVILPFFGGSTCCLLWKCNTKAAKDVAIWHCNRLWKLIMKVNSRVRAIEGNVDCDLTLFCVHLKPFCTAPPCLLWLVRDCVSGWREELSYTLTLNLPEKEV